MISQIFQLLQLGIVAFVSVIMAVEFGRRPVVLIYALLVVHFWELIAPVPFMRVVDMKLSPTDVVNLIALGAAAIRLRRPRGLQWPLIGLATLVLFSIVRALVSLGQSEAMLGFRAELYYIVPALLASTLKRHQIMAALAAVWWFGLCMSIFAAGKWFLLAFGIDLGNSPNPEGYTIARVINSGAAFGVAVAAVMGMWRWLNDLSARWHLPWTLLGMFAVVLFSQHRSVWVATATMLLIVFVATSGRIWLRASIVITLAALIVLVEAIGLGDANIAADSLYYAASNTGTWEWRLQRWQEVWHTHADRGLSAIIFGSGYGYSWVSGVVGKWEVSPHNGFLQIAVRTGLVGAAMAFGTYIALLLKPRRGEGNVSTILKVLAIGVLAYFIPYSGNAFSGLLLGITVAWFARSSDGDFPYLQNLSNAGYIRSAPNLPDSPDGADRRASTVYG